jgi:ABC-type transport system substrate-binding protein
VPQGFATTLLIDGSDSDSVSMASIIQSAWAEVGIQAKIEQTDLNTANTRVSKFEFDLALIPPDVFSSDVGAQDEIATFLYEPTVVDFGGYGYNSHTAIALLDRATHSINPKLRQSTFSRLQEYTMWVDPPEIPIAYGPARTIVSSKVQGLRTLLNYSWRLEDCWLSP